MVKKHEALKFRFKLSLLKPDMPTDGVVDSNSNSSQHEYLKKVQFLKLCDLNKIYTLFKKKQYDEANTYVKNSTQEIIFNAVKLTDDYDPRADELQPSKSSSSTLPNVGLASMVESAPGSLSSSSLPGYEPDNSDNDDDNDDLDVADDNDDLLDEYGGTLGAASVSTTSDLVEDVRLKNRLIKLKSEKSLSANKTGLEEEDGGDGTWSKKLVGFGETAKAWFWRHVPEEDFLLAVIVPITIVVSLFVLTIVVACLLHMFNKGKLI